MTEAEIAAEQVEEVAANGEGPASAADEAPKPRIKRPVKPDDQEYKAQMDKLQEQITQARKRMDEIGRLISGKRGSNETPESKALRTKMNNLRAEWQSVLEKKQQAKAELDVVTKTRESVRAQMRVMKGKLQYMTVDKIDEQIARLESQHAHTSTTLQEEKKLLEQIKTLKASRATVAEYNDKLDKLNQDEAVRGAVLDRMKAADETLNKLKADMEATRAAMDELKAKESAATSDIPALQDERTNCKALVDAAYAKKGELYTSFKARMEEFREQEKLWRVQRDEDRKRRQEQQRKEWEERQAARKAREAEMEGEPFYKEIGQCDQLLQYLSKYSEEDKAGASKSGEAKADAPTSLGDGFVLKSSKKAREDDLDSIFGGLGGGKVKGKKGKKKAPVEELDPEDVQLKHTIDIIDAFGRLKLAVPVTAAEVPTSVEALNAKKEYYLERRRKKVEGEEDPDAVDEEAEASSVASKPKAAANPSPADLADAFPALPGSQGAAAAKGASAGTWAANGNVARGDSANEDGESVVKVELDTNGDGVKLSISDA